MPSLSAAAKSRLYANFAKYAHSGMGMEKACESLLRQPRLRAGERRIYERLRSGLREGRTIGASLGSAGSLISPLEVEVVTAAEEGGRLEKGLDHLATYFHRADQTRKRIVGGLAYPLVLLHLAIPATTLAVTAFRSFSLDGSSPAFSFADAFLKMGKAFAVSYLVLAVIIAGAILLHRLARTSGLIDGVLRRLPLLGPARLAIAMERFAAVFEIFLLAGKTMSASLAGAGAASGSGLLREASAGASQIVAEGDLLAVAIFSAPAAFPSDFASGVASAEEAGVLDREMAEWGRYYAEAARTAMDRLGEWTPRLFYWAILLFVAVLMVRAGLAYRDLLNNLINFEI